jgi:hypothetical protein
MANVMRTQVPSLTPIYLVDSEINHVDREADGELLPPYYVFTLYILCNERPKTLTMATLSFKTMFL